MQMKDVSLSNHIKWHPSDKRKEYRRDFDTLETFSCNVSEKGELADQGLWFYRWHHS